MNEISSTEFETLYNDVFDSDDNIKICGRNKCKILIKKCNELNAELVKTHPDYFGSDDTGYMNVENIKNFARDYFKTKN